MSLAKPIFTVSFFTLLSRICGFMRDMIIASIMGASPLTDAFFIAFKIPNFLRRLTAEGAFNNAFVPMFAGILAAEGRDAAHRFSDQAFALLSAALLVTTVVFILFTPQLMIVLAPGFTDDPAQYAVTVELTRITFPYILFISLVALMTGVLNSMNRFAYGAASPILMNLTMIAAILSLRTHLPTSAHALAVGVFAAGVVQLIWMLYGCHKAGVLPRLIRPRLTPQVKQMLMLMGPAAVGAGVAQINLLVDTMIGSTIPNAVSYLYYADRINELPIGIIGVAIGTALLPLLSKEFRTGQIESARHTQNRALEIALFFALPATAALMVIADPIVAVLYEHGAFTPAARDATQAAIVAYSFGLPAYIAVKVFAPGFFANHDTKTPVKLALISMAVNLTFNLLLMGPMQHVGLALATAIAAWVNAGMMWHSLHKRGIFRADSGLKIRGAKLLGATLIMSIVLYGGQLLLASYFHASSLTEAIALAILIAAGAVTYGLAVWALKATDIDMIRRQLSRRRKEAATKTEREEPDLPPTGGE